MAKFREVIQHESCFQPGSAVCRGCMEAITFQNVGKVTDNGRKTIFTLGTFCGEVSTLQYPHLVAWGRGVTAPTEWTKSFGIIHHVFESAPTVAEGVRDTADQLTEMGALPGPVQVVACSGDGGALAIGLRSLLHTVHRGVPITIVVLVNEIFANTGFQYSPTTPIGADTSTTPVMDGLGGNRWEPIDYLQLCVAAGAGFVAQVSAAYPPFFMECVERALACPTTAALFVPSPCITGWKYLEGQTISLARAGCATGFFPCFMKEHGRPAELRHVALDPARRPPIESFMGPQRRFHHLVMPDPAALGEYIARPGHEATITQIRDSIDRRLHTLAQLGKTEGAPSS